MSKETILQPLVLATLEDLLVHLRIAHWDALLVGDGSGSNRSIGCGWACVIIDQLCPRERDIVWAAWSRGTVNIAELSAYVQGLYEYGQRIGEAGSADRQRHVHVLSDSQLIVNGGNGAANVRALDFLWAAVEQLKRRHKLRVTWHHLPRETTALNFLVDRVSREARLCLDDADPRLYVKDFDLNMFNPSRV